MKFTFRNFKFPIVASSSRRERPPRPTGPVVYKNLISPKNTFTHKEFVGLMKDNPTALKIWHNHRTRLKNSATDLQEVFYAVSTSSTSKDDTFKDESLYELLGKFYPSFESVREMSIPSDTFCGLDVMEEGFVFNGEEGRQRIVEHCLSHSSKGEALKENGLGTFAALEVFVPLFQTLLARKGRCSGIVKGDKALYLEYIGLMPDIAVTDATPTSRYYFLGFRAKRLEPDCFYKTIKRKNKKPKRDKVSKKLDDALTNKEELQVYNLVCEQMAIELTKDGKDIEKSRQQACRFFTDETKNSKRSDLYVETAQEYLSTHRVYSKSELRLGSMWLFNDFEKEQSAGIGALLELSLSTNLVNLLQ